MTANFTILHSSGELKKYFEPTGFDYYVENQDIHAFFGGELARRWGLKEFDIDQFHRLCDGLHPITGEQLTPGKKENKRGGYDLTVDGPKDLGILAAMGDERIIQEILIPAARNLAALVEADAMTRVRTDGQNTDRRTGNGAFSAILHTTARPVTTEDGVKIDMQPHVHMLWHNVTFDQVENRYKALQLQEWDKNGKKEVRPLYNAALNALLAHYTQKLGYEIEKDEKTGSFHVAGIPESVRQEFSQRTQKIEAVAAQLEKQKQEFLGDATATLNPEVKGRLGAHTRERKQPGRTWESLLEHWNSRITDSEREAIAQTVEKARGNHFRDVTKMGGKDREALDWAIAHEFERNAVVSERALLTTALKHGLGSVTPDGLMAEMRNRPDLIRCEFNGEEMVTTQVVLNEERAITAFAERGKGRWSPLGNKELRIAESNRSEPNKQAHHPLQENRTPTGPNSAALIDPTTLSPSQQAAIKHALTSRDSLIMIRGAAGSGKTTLTKALLSGVDVPYVVLAPSAEASRGVLRKEGVDPRADTLAKFLGDEEMQSRVRGGLIVLDEASLAGSHDLAKLVGIADTLKARVLLLGDRRQHKSVARGDVLALLEDKAGLKVAVVGEIRRQAGQYKEAVKLASEGQTAGAFEKLDRLGWIKEGHDALVEDYMAGVKAGKSQLIIAPTHAEGDTVTEKLRQRLKAEGVVHGAEKITETFEAVNLTQAEREDTATLKALQGATAVYYRHGHAGRAGDRVTITAENAAALAKEGSRFAVYRKGKIGIAAGDVVRITANGWDVTGEHRLNNGAVYQVDSVSDKGIRLSNGWLVGNDFGHIQHGLVVTSYAAQGRTVDNVLIAQSSQSFPASDRAQFYVSVSRGRQKAAIYTDDRSALLDAIDRERPRLIAHDLLAEKQKSKLRLKKKKAMAFMRELSSRMREPVQERRQERTKERHL